MKNTLTLTALLLALLAGPHVTAEPLKPAPLPRAAGVQVRIVLIGDSTVATNGGWGPGFAKLLAPTAECLNYARSGSSSKSYYGLTSWENALAQKPDYVLIQFGHNDMPGKGPERETDPATTYPQCLRRYIAEARAIGAKSILVTSLTRRIFGQDDKVHSDLIAYADAAKEVAAEDHVPLIDLHARSIALLDRLGPVASREFDRPTVPKPGQTKPQRDGTHLSPKGADVFGRVVAEELIKVEPSLAAQVVIHP